jgi:dienelactone hydrolase
VKLSKTKYTVIILAIVLLISTLVARRIDSDQGTLETEIIRISDGKWSLSAILHVPKHSYSEPRPAVVVTHGISSTKEMVDGISLELARKGIISLSIDLHGHGDSEGHLSSNDPSLGLQAALGYIRSRKDVDHKLIGVVGHSLGAGAARVVSINDDILATVFIAGGLNSHNQQGTLNPNSPKNLLVAVGSHDVLFNIEELIQDLESVFSDVSVIPNIIYGDLSQGTARKLVVVPTTHLLEPMDPRLISEVITWFMYVFDLAEPDIVEDANQIFLFREVSLLFTTISLFGIILLIPRIFNWDYRNAENIHEQFSTLQISKIFLLWGLPGIFLFFPVIAVGTFIKFPPQLFGSSIAWWLLSIAFIGLLLLLFLNGQKFQKEFFSKDYFSSVFNRNDIILAVILFTILYQATSILEYFTNMNPRFFVPILSTLTVWNRILVFPTYLPFFFVHFLVDGLFLFNVKMMSHSSYRDLLNVLGIKLIPYLIVVGSQNLGMFFFNFRLFPGFLGFMLEFMLGIIPILAITSISSWWFHKESGRIGIGVIFNTLLTAWIASSLFPFG